MGFRWAILWLICVSLTDPLNAQASISKFISKFNTNQAREWASSPAMSLRDAIVEAAATNSLSAEAAQCHARLRNLRCRREVYRPASAKCSSLTRNNNLGMADTPLARWLPGNYSRKGQFPLDHKLPNPRKLSMVLRAYKQARQSRQFTELFTTIGQYISHDFSLTPDVVGKSCMPLSHACFRSRETNLQMGCRPIFNEETGSCIPMKRSATICDKVSPVNEATSFIDASTVYGSHLKDMNRLRKGHRLRVNPTFKDLNGRSMMAFITDKSETCAGPYPCFLAGDRRASVAPPLAALHTLWMREHNRIADFFKARALLYPWSDERIFAETRKIVEAMHQEIAYTEYMPYIVGTTLGNRINRDWVVRQNEASTSNSFAGSAFRMAHANINPLLRLRYEGKPGVNAVIEDKQLHRHFWRPDKIISIGIDAIVDGLQYCGMKRTSASNLIAKTLTEKLFTEKLNQVNSDLMALDIARGRDLGLQPYLKWRRFCRLPKITSWNSLRRIWVATDKQYAGLRALYVDVANIDLFVGGVLEKIVKGALVGPTFRCLIGRQFLLSKNHDYYFHKRSDSRLAGVMGPVQAEHSLFAHLICRNTGVASVRRNPLLMNSPRVSCQNIPNLDLSVYLGKHKPKTTIIEDF